MNPAAPPPPDPSDHPSDPIHFVVLTGTSGAGKSNALNFFEDLGFFCVDNLPLPLLPQFVDLCGRSVPAMNRVALVMDVRERSSLADSVQLINALKDDGHQVETLFIDADDRVLIRRFSETRRPHPLSPDGSVLEGLALERTALIPLRDSADQRIDTSNYSVHDLKAYIQRHYGAGTDDKDLTISVVAFGFKYGIPLEADLLFDVRFLANPHFIAELKDKTGETPEVRDYVLADLRATGMLEHIKALLAFTIPEYHREGRRYLTVGIGCTGGKHRSVVLASELARHLKERGHHVGLLLRDAHGVSHAKAPL